MMKVEARIGTELLVQVCDQIVVEFDGVQFVSSREQATSKSSFTRPDFDDTTRVFTAGSYCKPFKQVLAMKEMLT
jgi:hypothetical protein